MKQEELLAALENLIIIAEERYDAKKVIDGDDVIALGSIAITRRFIKNTRDEMTKPVADVYYPPWDWTEDSDEKESDEEEPRDYE